MAHIYFYFYLQLKSGEKQKKKICLREDKTANIFLIRLKNFEHKRFYYSHIQGEFMDSLFYLETLKMYMPTYRVAQNNMPTKKSI